MVLVDTSVWIRYLHGHVQYRSELVRLLYAEQVAGHDLVYGELLIGDSGARKTTLSVLHHITRARTRPHDDVVALTLFRKLQGRGIGWIDVHLLASAMTDKMQFWTADAPLATIAKELGIGYK
jgi:predicted nucleic acid-binding protein